MARSGRLRLVPMSPSYVFGTPIPGRSAGPSPCSGVYTIALGSIRIGPSLLRRIQIEPTLLLGSVVVRWPLLAGRRVAHDGTLISCKIGGAGTQSLILGRIRRRLLIRRETGALADLTLIGRCVGREGAVRIDGGQQVVDLALQAREMGFQGRGRPLTPGPAADARAVLHILGQVFKCLPKKVMTLGHARPSRKVPLTCARSPSAAEGGPSSSVEDGIRATGRSWEVRAQQSNVGDGTGSGYRDEIWASSSGSHTRPQNSVFAMDDGRRTMDDEGKVVKGGGLARRMVCASRGHVTLATSSR
ncbi:MAG: hypothetical protein M1837_006841 [Sclerophora amabilis]|nr:MAG: hypothetical protein M1837_006841 [Sclerophora amabilis]